MSFHLFSKHVLGYILVVSELKTAYNNRLSVHENPMVERKSTVWDPVAYCFHHVQNKTEKPERKRKVLLLFIVLVQRGGPPWGAPCNFLEFWGALVVGGAFV